VLILGIPSHSKYGGLSPKVDVGIPLLNWVDKYLQLRLGGFDKFKTILKHNTYIPW